MEVTLERDHFGAYLLNAADGRSLYIQVDYDLPGIASNFGWKPCEFCDATDGTVDCAHHTAGEMIASAREYLDEHDGESFEDPGYFE